MMRPTARELYKKIAEAKTYLRERSGLFAHPAKAVGELEALDIVETKDVWELIQAFLEEIGPGDYAGTHPPVRSYEKTIEGKELFAFSWLSRKLKKECISNLL